MTRTLSLVVELLRAMRPHQWFKNLFVLAPLVFAEKLFLAEEWALDWENLRIAGLAFGLFSMAASSIYLLNDLMDRERDKQHPVKCNRPIASGRLPVPIAVMAAFTLGTTTLVLSHLTLPTHHLLVMAAYFANNIAYSTVLKHRAFLDIASIATGFMLRIAAGATAIAVPVTGWLYTCTFLLACFLALGKRRHELDRGGESAPLQREVLGRYRPKHVIVAMQMTALLTLGCFVAYALSDHAYAQFHTYKLVWTVPFILFGLWRFIHLVESPGVAESPTEAMVHDPLFLLNLLGWGLSVLAVIYA
jgi:4-hydroxybenzoate polyprenyltransferase